MQPPGTVAEAAEAGPHSSGGGEDGKHLLIHLDGVSGRVFSSELHAGNLENLHEFFGDEGIIEHGVTYYPPFTSVAVERVRDGDGISSGEIIDWTHYEREHGVALGQARVMLEYLRTMPRRSWSNLLHGMPGFHHLAGPALLNVPNQLERYRSVEFYWFGTDTFGHIWGEEHLRRELRRFDRWFGRMAGNLPEDVNVIIYADHGMGFGEVEDYDDRLRDFARDAFGEEVFEYFAHPHLYLHREEEAPEVARVVARETAQDFAFYRAGPGTVVGYTPDARLVFRQEGDRLRYEFEGSFDPLGYEQAVGYDGEALTPDEWLELTHALEYPYAPVRVFELFESSRSGEVITVLNPPKIKSGPWIFSGNHHGLTAASMSIPLLVRGPDLEVHYGRTALRVEDVVGEASLERIENRRPERDDHQMSVWWSADGETQELGADAVFSPAYRFRLGTEVGVHETDQLWGVYDVMSGFLSRLWVGGGLSAADRVRAAVFLDYEFRIRRIGVGARLSTADSPRWDLVYHSPRGVSLQLRNLETLGVRVRF